MTPFQIKPNIPPRCVCGYPKDQHAPVTLACPHNPGMTYGIMDLPEGATCGDCHHFTRTCEWLISCEATRTRCDWYPIRFTPKAHLQVDILLVPRGTV